MMRDERQRQLDLARRLDVASLGVAPRGGRFIGQVFAAASLPSCVPCVYAVHPVQLGGSEVEGGAGSDAIDTTRTVLVVVLGRPPSLGDLLVVHSAGGRWVAVVGAGGGTSVSCGSPCTACGSIFLLDGTVADANTGGAGVFLPVNNLSEPIDFTPGQQARFNGASPCTCATTLTGPYAYKLECNVNLVKLTIYVVPRLSGADPGVWSPEPSPGIHCPACTPAYIWLDRAHQASYPTWRTPAATNFTSSVVPTCSGGILTATFSFTPVFGVNPPVASATVSVPIISLGATVPSPYGYTSVCCQTFNVTGCNGMAIQAATVALYDSPGGNLLDSQDTTPAGQAAMSWDGPTATPCAPYVTVVEPTGRFVPYAAAGSLTMGGTTAIAPAVATGYHCFAGCEVPLADTLHATFATAGAQVFAHSGSDWVASFTASGHAYVVTIHAAATVTVTRDGTDCGVCTLSVDSCPDAFSARITIPAGSCLTELGNAVVTE